MTRSPQDVFKHHLDALSRRDVGALITDYAANATILTQQGAMQGTEGAEQFYRQAFEVLPDAQFAVQWSIFADGTLMAGWTATATAGHIHNGVDTLSFRNGLISLHASSFTIEPHERPRPSMTNTISSRAEISRIASLAMHRTAMGTNDIFARTHVQAATVFPPRRRTLSISGLIALRHSPPAGASRHSDG